MALTPRTGHCAEFVDTKHLLIYGETLEVSVQHMSTLLHIHCILHLRVTRALPAAGGWDPEGADQDAADGEEALWCSDGRMLDVTSGHWMPLEVRRSQR